MIAWSLVLEHGWALALVWLCVGLPGLALLPFLRARVGLAAAPLVGVVYWTVAIYAFPFAGGLDVAAGVIALLIGVLLAHRWRRPAGRMLPRWTWSCAILALGSLPYLTPLLYHYVPTGMDGSMHTTAAALIGRSRGLPGDYAPYAADVPFPAINLGLPALAGVAIRCGGEPAAVMLATQHLTFTCLILATYVLLRRWLHRNPAAVLAVASVWLARGTQATLGWGGFPTVLSVAVGVFAARMLLEHARTASWRLSLTTGLAIAAIPLIHGVGAGTWVYCAGGWTVLATLLGARRRVATWRGLALAGLAAATVLLVYRLSMHLDVSGDSIDTTRIFVQQAAPTEEGWRAWPAALAYARKDTGTLIVLAGWAACAFIAVRGRWVAAGLLAAAWLTVVTVVANSRWYVLPGSFLLYPERALYWVAPSAAIALALAWRLVPRSWQPSCTVALGLLAVSGYHHNQFFQKGVHEFAIHQDEWEALVWAKQHLDPCRHFVHAPYNTAASYLPAVAQIGCSGAHHHHFVADAVKQSNARRTCTHQFIETRSSSGIESTPGHVVYRNASITIIDCMLPH